LLHLPGNSDDAKSNGHNELWLCKIDGSNQERLIGSEHKIYNIGWGPKGKNITFLANISSKDKSTQVYSISIKGGELTLISTHSNSLVDYCFSDDGNWLAYIARDAKTDQEQKDIADGKDWKIQGANLKHRRLYVMNTKTKEEKLLTKEDMSVWSFCWHPDNQTLAFQATATPNVDDSYMFKKLYTTSVSSGKPKIICATTGKLGSFSYSIDGSNLAYLSAVSLNDPLPQSLFVVSTSTGTSKNLTSDYKGSVNEFCWQDNNSILFILAEGCYTNLYKMTLDNNKGTSLISQSQIIRGINFHAGSGNYSLIGNTPDYPSELHIGNIETNNLHRVTKSNPQLEDVDLAKQEIFEWKSVDGLTIQGILTYPLNYEEGNKYPLALQIHGGPEGVSLNGWNTRALYPVQVLAAHGYMVLEPNYRGSGGRGVAFSKGDHDDLGGLEFEDVLSGIDALIELGLVDQNRVGTAGWSYGGYFSALAATKYSHRFKAAIVGAGISNWISFTGTTDIPYEMSLVHWNSWWFDKQDLHWDRSPLKYIEKAKTPTLIVHGQNDGRVPPSQGLELYTALKINEIPSQFVLYPREQHGLRERSHTLDFIYRTLDWFDKYIQ